MKRRLIAISVVLLFLATFGGACGHVQVKEDNVSRVALETVPFVIGNVCAKKYPIETAIAAEIAREALVLEVWTPEFADNAINDIWATLGCVLAAEPEMHYVAKKLTRVVEYDSETQLITIPEEHVAFMRTVVSEFLVGVEMARGRLSTNLNPATYRKTLEARARANREAFWERTAQASSEAAIKTYQNEINVLYGGF